MAQPDLGLVSIFVQVVERASFTGAANALGLPKSTVSRGVAALEEGLGVRLLQRTSRTLSLTDAGRSFYERVRDPLSGVVEAMNDVTESSREPRGKIRFTAPPDLGSQILARPIAEFVRRYPHIRVELMLTSRIVDLVQERVDLALRATEKLADSSLVARKLGGPGVGLFAAKSYLDERGLPKTLADLDAHAFVIFRGHDGRATLRLRGPEGEVEREVRGPIEVDDIGFVVRAVREGAGIGLLPIDLAQRELVRVLPEYGAVAGTLYLMMPSGRNVPARVTLLRDFLIEALKRTCQG